MNECIPYETSLQNSNLTVSLLLPIALIEICQYVFVGNGFIRSETSVNINGSLDGNGVLFSTFFPFNVHPIKTLPGVTDKSVPYEISRQISICLDTLKTT